MPFDYTLSVQSSWPPSGRPQPPFGPTAIEIMRSCPLRSCFDVSPGYEQRMGVAARIGTAMHRTLQSLSEQPIQAISLEVIAAEARCRYKTELDAQMAQAAKQPREARLKWDPIRIDRALEAVIAEAIRTYGSLVNQREVGFSPKVSACQPQRSPGYRKLIQNPLVFPAYEVPVQSKDLLFRGRIDRVELIPEGTRLVDYKSAYRDDLPERYARQIQLYAYLWYETTGDWPIEGQVFYPLKGTFHQIDVAEAACLQVVAEAKGLIHQLGENKRTSDMAIPSDTCKVCDYRPWCRPFWAWQAKETNLVQAKGRASIGFEGLLESISITEHYWRLIINWMNLKIRLIVPQESFPHLENAYAGQLIRILDAPLKGALSQPTVQVCDNTEIFLLL